MLFFRKLLIFFYPFLILLLVVNFRLKITNNQVFFCVLLFVSTFISALFEGFLIENYLFSIYLILPIFILLTTKVNVNVKFLNKQYFGTFFNYFTWVLAFVNFSAFFYSQFLISEAQNFEDSFTGLYGHSGFGAHTLSIINLAVSVFYFYNKKYLKFTLFLICGVLGFYGLALLLFIAAFSFAFLNNFKKHWKTFINIIFSGLVVLYALYIINPSNFRYIEKNIDYAQRTLKRYSYSEEMEKAKIFKITKIPRYITFVDGAQKRFFHTPKVFFLGTSPGGYNSRVAFYFNGDFITNPFIKNSFNNRTKYHKKDVYPLLNRKFLERPYNDGTRNQPFSSIISILMEYGFIVGSIFLLFFFYKIREIRKKVAKLDESKSLFVQFLGYFLFLLFLFQNYLEYPEVVLPLILFIKLLEIDYYNTIADES